MTITHTPESVDRLAEKFTFDPDGCWRFHGGITGAGYGAMSIGGTQFLAHRVMYELIFGPIAPEFHIDHLCRRRECINPDHMELVTPRVNTLRGVGPSARNATKTHCDYGHEFTPENTYAWRGRRRCRACLKSWRHTARKNGATY